jgi:cytochrome c
MKATSPALRGATLLLALSAISFAHAEVDVEAAKALAKANDCLKCHAATREKKGPSMQKIAEKYKGKADAQETLIKNMTEAHKVKLSDGTEEEHKVIDTKDPAQLKNIANWYLSH